MNTLSSTSRVLIVDDEALFAKALSKRLQQAGYDCQISADLEQAWVCVQNERPDIVLLDMRLPDGSGLAFLQELRQKISEPIAVVVMTAYGEIDDAVAAMKHNALDYLKKPFDLDELVQTLDKARERLNNEKQTHAVNQHNPLRPRQQTAPSDQTELIGTSPAMQQVKQQLVHIGRLSFKTDTPATVLILGATGTGKDLAARCLHKASSRHERPFVHVDCAALPKDLIEAELFGHEKGAFTNAHSARVGLIEAAQNGTVFLDEVAELPPDLQTKLLAVLERRVLRRIGSSSEISISAWFIAATNQHLQSMIDEGLFRADLFYRLNVLSLHMPTLGERGDDVILLAKHFVANTASRYGLDCPSLSEDAMQALQTHHWPGNVRELANVIERAVLLSAGAQITAASLPLQTSPNEALIQTSQAEKDAAMSTNLSLESAEETLIRQALARSNGNVSEAARILDITRMTLRYRMQKYGIIKKT